MSTITYTARSTLDGFSSGTYTGISGTTTGSSYTLDTEYTVPPHSPGAEQEMYNSDSSLNATGDVYTGFTVNGYPVVQNGSAYYVYHDGAVSNGGSGSAATLNAFTLCFLKGTRILTAKGEIAVEALQIGDQLITDPATGGTVPVKFVFTDTYQQPFLKKLESYPICIQAHALSDNVPSRDLYVSPDHAIYFPEWKFFVEASILAVIVNDTSIYQVPTMPESFT